jgi:hypothetical protein
MISLKKNDKIIIIAAVIVLLTASVGVAMWQSPKTEIQNSNPGQQTYKVSWIVQNGTLDTISEHAGKKTPYETAVKISDANLKSITFNMTWTDDHMTFFKRMGLDTLSLEVKAPNGDIVKKTVRSAAITGYGEINFTIDTRIIPPQKTVSANDLSSAQAMLKNKPFIDTSWMDKNINITVSDKIGEKRIRILQRFLDKGNDFSLVITYQYFEGKILNDNDSIINTNLNKDPTTDPWEPPYMSMIISTGCGRYV